MTKKTKTRTRLSPEARENEILAYAAQVVSQEGVIAVSIEQIGKALNISKSTVYSYFPSTTELLKELLKREMKSLRSAQHKAMENANTVEQVIRDVTHIYLNYIEEKGLLISRLQSEPSLSSVGGPADYGKDFAIKYMAEILRDTFGIPLAIGIPSVSITFGLPDSAGRCLIEKLADKQTIEDLTVAMILACIRTTTEGYDLKFRTLPKRNS